MKRKPLQIVLTVLLLMTLVFGVAAVNAAEKDSAKLTFSGITMKAQGDGVQGFLDVKITDVASKGVSFTLEYDTDWVELSYVDDNTVPESTKQDDVEPFVAWNEKDFSPYTFAVDGEVDSSNKIARAQMDIYVTNIAPLGGYIEEHDVGKNFAEMTKVVNASDKTLTLGKISFNIKKPAEFAKLTQEELTNIFRVGTNADGSSTMMINYIDHTCDPPVVFYDQESHLSYEFDVENSIAEVKVNNDNAVTNAAYVYDKGIYADVLGWLNGNMQNVTVCYVDGTEIADTIVWSEDAEGFKLSKDGSAVTDSNYVAKGGTYVIEQNYNEDIKIRATVEIKPVTVMGYTCENDYLHYESVDKLPTGTDYHEILSLPESVTAVYDAFVAGKTDVGNVVYVEQDRSDDDYVAWSCTASPAGANAGDLLSIKNDGVEGQYEYSAAVVPGLPSWATVPSDLCVTVTRVLGAATPEPTFKWEVTDDGWLIISEIKVSGYADISKVDFSVRLPNGLVLDASEFANTANGGYYKVESDGDSAKISLKAGDITNSQQSALQQAINLGKKLGKFALAAQGTDPAKPRSDWKEFETEPRHNVYLGAGSDNTGDYSFDYSDVSNIFSIEEDATNLNTPPLTVTLPQGDFVKITYSGQTGFEPGKLSTITVREWRLSAGDELKAGNVVTFTGKLANAYYADHGEVWNDNDIEISLTLAVTAAKAEEKISDIEDIIFSKMQVGYTITEDRQVLIENIGTVDINGLTVTMTPESGSEDAFTMTVAPPYVLAVGDSISCRFDRNLGLPTGTYRAKVTIGSNRTAVLEEFYVSVEIIEEAVYKVNVVVESGQEAWGTAKSLEGSYFAIGDEVKLQARMANEDYTFLRWEKTVGPTLEFKSTTYSSPEKDPDASFEMPSDITSFTPPEVTVKAVFEARESAVLRLQELHLYNPDDAKSENDLLVKDEKGEYSKVAFAPQTTVYYAIVPDSAETNRAEFVFTQPDEGEVTVTAALSVGGKETDLTDKIVQDTTDKTLYYIDYADLPLTVAPANNELKITLTLNDNVRSYTVSIMRKIASEDMAEFGYGNSPFGLIMQDGTVDHEEKKAAFRLTNSFVDYVPSGAHKGLVYHPDAWGNTAAAAAVAVAVAEDDATKQDVGNYDRNDYALFVYVGEEFTDPGIGKVKNSLGETVAASSVTATVYGLNALGDYSADKKPVDDFRQGTPYDLTLVDGKATVAKRVRPGVYTLTYEYKDYNGDTLKLTRPLIVLYKLGDVNMNGTVNADDAAMLANRYNARLPYGELAGYESNCRLYQYRICDVNCDRNVNIGDRNQITNSVSLTELYK